MSKVTKIEWCDSTVNPTMGCDGCELWVGDVKRCYAGRLHAHRGDHKGYAPKFEQVTRFPGRMEEAASWGIPTAEERKDKPWMVGQPRVIFISDMSDSLSKAVSFDYLKAEIIDVVRSGDGQRHAWVWLTKRPSRMAEFSLWLELTYQVSWPSNLWAGTSLTTQKTANVRLDALRKVGNESTRRCVSIEPLWTEIQLGDMTGIHWVKAGGESGPDASPTNPDWFKSLRDQCKAASVPFFFKQWGEWCFSELVWSKNGRGLEFPIEERWGMVRIGKVFAGRLLDGQEENNVPDFWVGVTRDLFGTEK